MDKLKEPPFSDNPIKDNKTWIFSWFEWIRDLFDKTNDIIKEFPIQDAYSPSKGDISKQVIDESVKKQSAIDIQPRDYGKEITELRMLIENIPIPKNYDNKIYDIETMVASGAFELRSPAIKEQWPIDSIYESTVDTNPAILLGYGTWESFADGRYTVAYKVGDPDFGAGGAILGAKTHDHPSTVSGGPSSTETVDNVGGGSTVNVASSTHTHHTDLLDIAHLPPSIVIYRWTRTA